MANFRLVLNSRLQRSRQCCNDVACSDLAQKEMKESRHQEWNRRRVAQDGALEVGPLELESQVQALRHSTELQCQSEVQG